MAFQPQPKLFSLMGWNATGDLGPFTFYTSKRRKLVWFIKAPPTTPPTYWQLRNQNNFHLIAHHWRSLTPQYKAAWERATKRLSLRLTGYNLFIYCCMTGDTAAIRTIEHQSGETLLPTE